MAGLGRKVFAFNEVLTAADVNGYLMDQSVQRFASAAARETAIPAPSEGMVCYLDDINQVEVYDGTDWVNFTGDITAVTAGIALTGGGSSGSVNLDVDISAVSTAQAGNGITATGEVLSVDIPTVSAAQAGTALTSTGAVLDVDIAVISTAQAGIALDATGTVLDVNISELSTAQAGTALTVVGDTLNVDATAIEVNNTQVNYTVATETGTTYTLVTADANKYIRFTNAATVTIGTSADFAVGDQVTLIADGSSLTIAAGGATLAGSGTSGTAVSFTVGAQFEAVSILCVATDNYRLIGNITVV